jgi:hypothetical protein
MACFLLFLFLAPPNFISMIRFLSFDSVMESNFGNFPY